MFRRSAIGRRTRFERRVRSARTSGAARIHSSRPNMHVILWLVMDSFTFLLHVELTNEVRLFKASRGLGEGSNKIYVDFQCYYGFLY